MKEENESNDMLVHIPDFADAHYYLGNAYFRQGQYQEAIAPYKEAIRIKPGV